MKFLIDEKIRNEKLYSVGYCPGLKKYILVCVVPWIVWYNRYYEITKAEYDSFGSKRLDSLAKFLYEQGSSSERFLCSDKNEENNNIQLKLRDKLWK